MAAKSSSSSSSSSSAPFYVPYDQIKPMVNKRGEAFVTIWQAFPWLKRFYANYGVCLCVGVWGLKVS